MIRLATLNDAEAICDIYNYYIENTRVTFEETPITAIELQERMSNILPSLPFLVYVEDGKVLAYAYATKWKSRSAYRFSVESTIYVDKDHQRKGIGTKLYEALLKELKEKDIHRVIGGVALPNEGSVRVHENLGFTKVAEFTEVGFKMGSWINVAYWEIGL